jgi:hypothetical protein
MSATSVLSVESITTSAQMNPILLGPSQCFVSGASGTVLMYDASYQLSCTEFKQALRHEPLAKAKGKEGDTGRFRVRVTSFRRRLTDQDNLAPKFFIDCLRYAGVIPDDSPQAIDYTITQVKVRKKEEERTEIEVDEAP